MTNTVKAWAKNYEVIALNEGTTEEVLNNMTTEEKATRYIDEAFGNLCGKLNEAWYTVFEMENFEGLMAKELNCNKRQLNNKVFNTWYNETAYEI